jgi:serine phosphatase RsbU (regulator of sigma subunit)
MEAHLAPGEGLLLYTDGLTEAENRQGEAFGVERCLQLSGTAEPDALLDRLLDGWSRFAETDPPADDCALLAIQRKISG